MGSEEGNDGALNAEADSASAKRPMTREEARLDVREELRRSSRTQRIKSVQPRPLPSERAVRRALELCVAVWCVGIILQVFWHLLIPLGLVYTSIAFPLLFVIASRARWYEKWRTHEARRLLAPHRAFICLRCHYPLRSLPDAGVCPECGLAYTREETVRIWTRAYRLDEATPDSARADKMEGMR